MSIRRERARKKLRLQSLLTASSVAPAVRGARPRRAWFESLESRAAPSTLSLVDVAFGAAVASAALQQDAAGTQHIVVSGTSLKTALRRSLGGGSDWHAQFHAAKATAAEDARSGDEVGRRQRGNDAVHDKPQSFTPSRKARALADSLATTLAEEIGALLGDAPTDAPGAGVLRALLQRTPTPWATGGGEAAGGSGRSGGDGGGSGGHARSSSAGFGSPIDATAASDIVVTPFTPSLPTVASVTTAPNSQNGDAASAAQNVTSGAVSPSALAADGDGNGRVDGGDFLMWQRSTGPMPSAVGATLSMASWTQGFGAAYDGADFLNLQRSGVLTVDKGPSSLADFKQGFGADFDGFDFLGLQRGGVDAMESAPTSAAEFAAGFGGKFDGGDMLRWQREFGVAAAQAVVAESNASGDFNADGAVNEIDLTVWQASFGESNSAAVVTPDVTQTGFYGAASALHTFNVLSGPDSVINVPNGVNSVTRQLSGNVVGPFPIFFGHGDVSMFVLVNGNSTSHPNAFEDSASGATLRWGTGANGSSPVNVEFGAGRSEVTYRVRRTSSNQTVDVFASNSLAGARHTGFVAVNRRADAVDDALELFANATKSLNLLGNDLDDDQSLPASVRADDPLRVTAVNGNADAVGTAFTLPSGAKVTVGANGTATYDPRGVARFLALNADETATDSFTYEVSDGYVTDVAIATITVTGVNDPPSLVTPQIIRRVGQGGVIVINATQPFSDPEEDQFAIVPTSISTPQQGMAVASADGQSITYTQTSATPLDDRFTYFVSDGNGNSAPATVVLSVVAKPQITGIDDDVSPIVGQQGNGATTNDTLPVLRGTAEPGAEITLTEGNESNVLATTTADAAGNWMATIAAPLSEKKYTIVANGVSDNPFGGDDVAVVSDPFDLTVDATLPTVTSFGPVTPALRNLPLIGSVPLVFDESVSGVDLADFSLSLNSGPNLLPGSVAIVSSAGGAASTTQWSLSNLAGLTQTTGSYRLTFRGAGSSVADAAGNEVVGDRSIDFVVDGMAPTAVLTPNEIVFSNHTLAIPVLGTTNPAAKVLDVTITDQTFSGAVNDVKLDVAVSQVRTDGTTVERTLPTQTLPYAIGADGANVEKIVELSVSQLGATDAGSFVVTIRVTDGAGTSLVAPLIFAFDVPGTPQSTAGAPGTPVSSEMFYIGARITKAATLAAPDTIEVDQPIPDDYTIHIGNESFLVDESETNTVTKVTTLKLKRFSETGAVVSGDLTEFAAGSKVAWLRPWQTSLDKTTQTIWFTLEDGHQLGHFDPATGKVELYDVSVPTMDANGIITGRQAFDPHGAIFDFDSHVTPRVWLVYRNTRRAPGTGGGTGTGGGVGGGTGGGGGGSTGGDAAAADLDTPGPTSADLVDVARVSYFDLVQEKLFTFDFADGHFMGTALEHGGVVGTHAVFVDARGDVWMSAGHSKAVVQLDFDGAQGSLNSTSGRIIVHPLPEGLAHRAGASLDFDVHGIQVVVDERSGQQYVYLVDANPSGRMALLLPAADENPGDPGSDAVPDRWFEWNFDPALDFEQPPLNATGAEQPQYRVAHALFTAIDDNETPGIPEDDRIILGDTGRSFRFTGNGVLRRIDVGSFIRNLQTVKPGLERTPIIRTTDLPTGGESLVETIRVTKIDGAPGRYSAPIQTFVDRAGTIFAVDGQGGVMRVNFDEVHGTSAVSLPLPLGEEADSGLSSTFMAAVVGFAQAAPPIVTEIEMEATTPGPMAPFWEFKAAVDATAGVAGTESVSARAGVNQYFLGAGAIRRGDSNLDPNVLGAGAGPFRGAMNATNVMYGALSQSDHLSTTVFAETARRQMTAVASPTAGSLSLRGRMAFQTLRDGSVVLTARADGIILDQQKNLTQILATAKSLPFDSIALAGEPTAVVGSDGVYLFGVSLTGRLVTYQYTGRWNSTDAMFNSANWQIGAQMPAPAAADGLLVGAPTAVVESSGRVAVFLTTSAGQLLRYYAGGSNFTNLTTGNTGMEVYASPGVVQVGARMYVYGSNQTGELIEYSYDVPSSGAASAVKRTDGRLRDVRVFQDLEAVTFGGVRHVYGTDGNSRLVHIEISDAGVVTAENVSQLAADSLADADAGNDAAFGFFPFQREYVGRVYSGLEVLVDTDGRQFIYGTNGANLILFIRDPSRPTPWRVANLTNDGYAIYGNDRGGPGQAPTSRLPANSVFGSPGGYIEPNGDRHIFQINAEGEVVEYYILQNETLPRFHTQNVNLRTGRSSTELLFPESGL